MKWSQVACVWMVRRAPTPFLLEQNDNSLCFVGESLLSDRLSLLPSDSFAPDPTPHPSFLAYSDTSGSHTAWPLA